MKSLCPDFLDNIFHFAFPPRVAAGGGEQARGGLFDQRLKASGVAFEHRGNQIRIRWLHEYSVCLNCKNLKAESRATECPARTTARHVRVIPVTFSNSAENRSSLSRILGGCSRRVESMRCRISGLSFISSAAATTNAKSPLMSCRNVESLRFNS